MSEVPERIRDSFITRILREEAKFFEQKQPRDPSLNVLSASSFDFYLNQHYNKLDGGQDVEELLALTLLMMHHRGVANVIQQNESFSNQLIPDLIFHIR